MGLITAISRLLRSPEAANALSNILGKVFNLVCSVLFLPIYLTGLGHEAYGLVAFQTTLQVIFSVLELGLPASVTREIALHSALDQQSSIYPQSVLRTSEGIAALVGLLVATVIAVSSPVIASKWLVVQSLNQTSLTQGLRIIGCQVGIQFLSIVYVGALVGAQRQVWQNAALSTGALVRGLGSVLVVILFHDVRGFLLVQLVVTAGVVVVLRHLAYRALPKGKGSMSLGVLKIMYPFASQMILNNLVLTLAAQLDRMIMSNTMPISYLGYYSLASFVANIIFMSGAAMTNSVYPVLVHETGERNEHRIDAFYLSRSTTIASLMIPMTAFLIFFGYDVMMCWLRDPDIVAKTKIALPCLVLSSYFSGISQMPVALAAARGRMFPVIVCQLVLTVILVAPLYFLILNCQLDGAALGNLIASSLYFFLITPVVHYYADMSQHWQWLRGVSLVHLFPGVLLVTSAWFLGCLINLGPWVRVLLGSIALMLSLAVLLRDSLGLSAGPT